MGLVTALLASFAGVRRRTVPASFALCIEPMAVAPSLRSPTFRTAPLRTPAFRAVPPSVAALATLFATMFSARLVATRAVVRQAPPRRTFFARPGTALARAAPSEQRTALLRRRRRRRRRAQKRRLGDVRARLLADELAEGRHLLPWHERRQLHVGELVFGLVGDGGDCDGSAESGGTEGGDGEHADGHGVLQGRRLPLRCRVGPTTAPGLPSTPS